MEANRCLWSPAGNGVVGWREDPHIHQIERAAPTPLTSVPGTSIVSEQEVDCLQQGCQNCLPSIKTDDKDNEAGVSYAVG